MKLCWACQMEFIFVGVGVGRYKKQLHFSLLIRSIRQPFRHISSDSSYYPAFWVDKGSGWRNQHSWLVAGVGVGNLPSFFPRVVS